MVTNLKDKPNLSALIEQFNENDISPILTRDRVLSGVSNPPKSYTKEQAQSIFGEDELTDEDLAKLKAEAEARLALKRGLIDIAQFNKTIVQDTKKAKTSKDKKGLKSVGKIAKSKKSKISNLVENTLQEANPKTKSNGRYAGDTTKSNDLKEVAGMSSILGNPKNLEKFEENFLFSTKGLLNGEVLLDILKDTWDIYNNKKSGSQEEESGSEEDKKSLMGTMLKISGAIALFKKLKKKLREGIKALKGKFIKLFDKMKDAFKKIFVDPIVKIFKYINKLINKFLKKGINAIGTLIDGIVKGKSGAKAAKGASSVAGKTSLKAAAKVAKSSVAKKASKAAANTAAKTATKSATKKGLKSVLSKIPVASALIDLGFMEAEVRSDMNTNNISREQAYENLIERKKEEEFSWWDIINPFGFGQKVGAKLGIDKAVAWPAEKIGELISIISGIDPNASLEERMKKHEAESRKKFGVTGPIVPKGGSPKVPENIKNPELRKREKEVVYTEIPSKEVNMTPIKWYTKDSDESPISGFGYLGEY